MGGNHRLQVFDTDGTFVTMWTDLQQPMDISIDKSDIFYVSEGQAGSSSARISVLNGAGPVIIRFPCRWTGHGSWVDSHGDIYPAVSNPGAVDKFVRQH